MTGSGVGIVRVAACILDRVADSRVMSVDMIKRDRIGNQVDRVY